MAQFWALLYLFGWSVLPRLPERLIWFLADCGGALTWWLRLPGVRQWEKNVEVVTGLSAHFVRRRSRSAMQAYARYWVGLFLAPSWSSARLSASCRAVNDDLVRAELAQGRGVVVALAHLGSWDLAGAWSARKLAPVATVAESVQPESLARKFAAVRRKLGITALPVTARETGPKLAAWLKTGGLVAIVADRDLTGKGVQVQFGQASCTVPMGPAALALSTGVELIPALVYEDGPRFLGQTPRYVVDFKPPVQVPQGTRAEKIAAMAQQCAHVWAEGISNRPEQWHVLQPLATTGGSESLPPPARSTVR